MPDKSEKPLLTTFLQLAFAILFVALGVAAWTFGNYLECEGGG